MGDVGNPLGALAAQVNRFGPGAPLAYQFVSHTFPVASVTLDPELALVATTIYQRRSTDAYAQYHDAGSAAAIERANRGFADPVTFVTANLSDVTNTIGGFADAVGLPMSTDDAAGGGLGTTTILLIAGAAVGLWMVLR